VNTSSNAGPTPASATSPIHELCGAQHPTEAVTCALVKNPGEHEHVGHRDGDEPLEHCTVVWSRPSADSGDAFTINPDGPPAPACPSWCTRPDLSHEAHRDSWDFDDHDGHVSRNHHKSFGEHVQLVGWESSAAPGVVQDHHIEVFATDADLSYADAIKLAAALLGAAAELDAIERAR
jgi:hypothetical protein